MRGNKKELNRILKYQEPRTVSFFFFIEHFLSTSGFLTCHLVPSVPNPTNAPALLSPLNLNKKDFSIQVYLLVGSVSFCSSYQEIVALAGHSLSVYGNAPLCLWVGMGLMSTQYELLHAESRKA